MQCRMCGYEFDEKKVKNKGCNSCGKDGCNLVHCPNCGFGNTPAFEEEFDLIVKLKNKLKSKA